MRVIARYERVVIALLAVASCFMLVSCRGGHKKAGHGGKGGASPFDKPLLAKGTITIKIITNGTSTFWTSMDKGMTAALTAVGAQGSRVAPRTADNSAQKSVFDDAVAAGVNGIAVSPIQADAFAPVIDSAIEKGIPVITFDSDSDKSKRLVYLGTDNYEAGKIMGGEAIKLFPSGGNLVAFVGNMSAQNARDRYQGFLDAVKGKNINMLQVPYEDDNDSARPRRNVADAITKYGDKINGFLGLYSYNGPAIVDEVQKANIRSKVKILCFDGEPRTLQNLQKGLVDVTVVQKPYEFGYISVKLLYLINREGLKKAMAELKPELEAQGMKVKNHKIDTGVEVVTPANAGPFIQKLKEKGLEST